MKLNVNEVVKNLDGESLRKPERLVDGKLIKSEKLTIKDVVLESLLAFKAGEGSASGEEKFKRYEIASLINKGGIVELTTEQVLAIKNRVGEMGYTIVVGYIWSCIEKMESKEDKKVKGK